MNQKVEEYIRSVKEETDQKKREERREELRRLGFYDVEYSKEGRATEEYPYYDYKKKQYYKVVDIEVTDEEYAAICECSVPEKKGNKKNLVVIFLTILAFVIMIVEFLYGCSTFQFAYQGAIQNWVIGGFIGGALLGLAEIIKALEKISQR